MQTAERRRRPEAPAASAEDLSVAFEALSAPDRIRRALDAHAPGKVALVSSFGADSVALIHLVAAADPATPVLFIDTEMLFPETLDYQAGVARDLGLTDLRIITPASRELAAFDSLGDLHEANPDRCCHLRKVRPLRRALKGFDGWISGRKRHQNGARAGLAFVETDEEGRRKFNPLADWSAEDARAYARRHGLPPHPLVARGYPSIGCAPCTSPVAPGEDPRAGRWRGAAKTECGIHFEGGKIVRSA